MDGSHYAYARNLCATLLALSIVGIAGCGDPDPMTGTDAGTLRVDSGRMGADAGMPTDSGMAMVDGGMDTDGGRVKTDGGMDTDGGMVADGGSMKTDGGMSADGGTAADGGSMKTDGGMSADASVGMDGGSAVDAATATDAAVARMCPDGDLGMALGAAVAMGTNTGSFDDAVSPCGDVGGEDMAYTWTAPAAGDYIFDTFGSTYDTTIHVHDGAMCDGTSLGCNDDSGPGVQSSLTVRLTAGQLVTIVVDGYDDTELGDFVLNITAVPPCPDADLGSAEGSAVVTGTTVGASADATGSCGGGAAEDVGFTWTAPRAGSWTFDTLGSAFDTVLHVHDGAMCDGTSLGCSDDVSTSVLQSSLTLTLTAGQTITIVVDGYDASEAGDYTLNISGPPVPGCITGDLMSATGAAVAMGMNAGAGDEVSSCGDVDGLDVAYTWTAPSAGIYTFDTAGSTYDTVLLLQRGNTCAGAEIACNDDAGATLQSSITQMLAAGDVITIVIDGYDDTEIGSYVLNISGPLTATCAGTDLGSMIGASVATGTNVGAGDDTQGSCGATGGLDVAHTWTAPSAGSFTFDTAGSTYDTVIYVRDAATCALPPDLECNDDSGSLLTSSTTVTLSAGQMVGIVIDGYDDLETGTYVLNITAP